MARVSTCLLICHLWLHLRVGPQSILRSDFVDAVLAHGDALDEAVIHARDYGMYLYVGNRAFPVIRSYAAASYSLQTLYSFYLLRFDDVVVERPQFLYMRVAVAIHGQDLNRVLSTYDLLSHQAYTPATPTLYNAGTRSQYLASCFMYQPPVGTAVSIAQHAVSDLGAFWTSDGGVGMNIGTVPAREFVIPHISCTFLVWLMVYQRIQFQANVWSGPGP